MREHNNSMDVVVPIGYEVLTLEVPIWPEGHRLGSTGMQNQKRRAMARDGWKCQMEGCGRKRRLECHHILPRSKGGSDNLDNLIILCAGCHGGVHDGDLCGRYEGEFLRRVERNRGRLRSWDALLCLVRMTWGG